CYGCNSLSVATPLTLLKMRNNSTHTRFEMRKFLIATAVAASCLVGAFAIATSCVRLDPPSPVEGRAFSLDGRWYRAGRSAVLRVKQVVPGAHNQSTFFSSIRRAHFSGSSWVAGTLITKGWVCSVFTSTAANFGCK